MSAPDISAFGQMMAGLLPEPPARIAVAVSGGADSMALAVLAQGWAKAYGVALHAITVDHQLRPESTAEAERVASWLQARGIAHTILTWHHDNLPQANLQAAARDARYRLMTMWCTTHNVQHLLLGHHLDDQAETFLIRLQRGSGVDGLAAMKPVTTRHGLTLLRPLLTIPKDELQDILRGIGQEWIEDPGNHNTDHTRVRMRQLLAEQGIDSYALAATATRMARARDFLEQETARAIATCVTFHTEGYITLDTAVFNALHEEIGLRVLADCIRAMNGQVYRPRFGELHSLHTGLGSPRTLAGCRFMPQNGGLRIQREQVAIAPGKAVQPDEEGVWDGRFHYRCGAGCPKGRIAALESAGWAHVLQHAPEMADTIPLPKALLHTLPALWHLEKPILVPHIGYKQDSAEATWLDIQTFRGWNGS